jgi:hypothetical protein
MQASIWISSVLNCMVFALCENGFPPEIYRRKQPWIIIFARNFGSHVRTRYSCKPPIFAAFTPRPSDAARSSEFDLPRFRSRCLQICAGLCARRWTTACRPLFMAAMSCRGEKLKFHPAAFVPRKRENHISPGKSPPNLARDFKILRGPKPDAIAVEQRCSSIYMVMWFAPNGK